MIGELLQTIRFHAEPLLARSERLFSLFSYLNDQLFARSRSLQVFAIQGQTKVTGFSMRTLFTGTDESSAWGFANQAYSRIDSIKSLTHLKQSQISFLQLPSAEIVAARVDRSFMKKFLNQNYLILPNVSFRLDLHQSMSSIVTKMSRRRRRDIRKIKGFGYSYSISRKDQSDLDFFYKNMYLPYALKRFKEAANVKTYLESKTIYGGNGGILFLKKKDVLIAGILFQIRGKKLFASSFGVYEGNESRQDLPSQASLFSIIEWGKTQGMTSLDYGACSPFLKDGIFTYKKEWGMTVEEQKNSSVCVLRLNSVTRGSLSFLLQNPFLIMDKGRLKAITFLDHKPSDEELRQVFSSCFLPGIKSLVVIAYSKLQSELDAERVATKYPNLTKSVLSICEVLQNSGSGFCVQVSELIRETAD